MRKPLHLRFLWLAEKPVARLQGMSEGDIKMWMRFIARFARAGQPHAEGFGHARVAGLSQIL